MLKGRAIASWVGVTLLVLSACGPAATPSPVPRATEQRAQATATPRPTASAPVATPAPTPTPAPTAKAVGAGQPKYGGVLRIVGPDVRDWDPLRVRGMAPQVAMSLIHQKLYNMNLAKQQCTWWPPEPAVAESWSWVNDLTLEIKVRSGVRFQNLPPLQGRQVTAADVAYTLNEQWKKKGAMSPAVVLVERAEAVDQSTVRFYLKEPFGTMMDKISAAQLGHILAPEMFAQGPITRGEQNVGLGPFQFKSHVPGVKIELAKNPNFWRQGLPYLDGIDMLIMPDAALQSASLRSGRIDWLAVLTPALNVELERTAPHLKVADCPGPPSGYGLYMLFGKPPFNDVRVRRAVSVAIDRKGVAQKVMQGKGIILYSSVYPDYPEALKLEEYPPEVRQWLEYNPQRAKQLLAEAGYPNGFKTTLITLSRQPELAHAETASAFLGAVGIRAELTVMEEGQYNTVVYGGQWDEGMAMSRAGSGEVHTNLYDPYHSSTIPERNRARIRDSKLDKMLDDYTVERDPARQKDLARQIQTYTVDQAYMVFLPREITGAYAQPGVKDLYYRGADARAVGDYLFRVWMDK